MSRTRQKPAFLADSRERVWSALHRAAYIDAGIPAPSASRAGESGPDRARVWTAGILIVLLASVGLGAGCYSFSGSNLPSYIKTVVVPTVENATLEPGIEQEITIGLTEKFVEDGRLKLGTTGTADARLDARLTQYDNKVNNYSASQQPLDYILVVSLEVHLRDMVKNRELWSDDRLTATAVYVPGGTSGLTTEREARQQVIQEIARDVVTRTLEQW